jgi:bifunctional non-homologous end joining protein LigD
MPVKSKSVPKAKAVPFPQFIEPMLCTLIENVSNDDNFVYEVKWDGYRVGAYIRENKASLKTRSAIDYSKRYIPVKEV